MGRSGLKLNYIEEPDGHRIERLVVEQFRPWCNECKRVVADFFEEDMERARGLLIAHMQLVHHQKPATAA